MNTKLFKWIVLYSLSILTFVFLPIGQTVASEEPKEIDLATNPVEYLFNMSNMKPGDWADRTLTIQNNGKQDFKYTVRAKRKSGSEMLYNQLELKVSDSKEVLYEGKLSGFAGFEQPRLLASSDEEDLQFKITFPWESGNEFQGLATEVVLKFAVEGELTPGGTDPGDEESTGGDSLVDPLLPDTGETNPFYYYMAGFILMLAGVSVFAIRRRPDRK